MSRNDEPHRMIIELIPSARRLIRSLRDIGYEFVDAVADIVDNSVEAGSTVISISLRFDGEDSYLTIADNGLGMASKEIQEALRFGSNRSYDDSDDLGRYGLGLKTASLSQCEKLTVSARRGEERARINSYCWDLAHIERTNRWEVLKVESDKLKDEARSHLGRTTGTVVTWERLGRLMGYKYPSGEHARKQSDLMALSLKTHLGMIFHRFLSGEVNGKRISIYINDEKVAAWDPYSRGEPYTLKLDQFLIPLEHNGVTYNIRVNPYILPPQSLYSSNKAHLLASGPNKWNKQQGLYIYRANRIIQAGGWNGLRTSDEHTKLLRVAMFVPSQLDEVFQVNVAKKHAHLPREIRPMLAQKLQPIIQRAQDVYREKLSAPQPTTRTPNVALTEHTHNNTTDRTWQQSSQDPKHASPDQQIKEQIQKDLETVLHEALKRLTQVPEDEKYKVLMNGICLSANQNERQTIQRLILRYMSNSTD